MRTLTTSYGSPPTIPTSFTPVVSTPSRAEATTISRHGLMKGATLPITNVGFHHIPRMEDWPVMPAHWAYFHIKPFNFFTENPSIMLTEASGLLKVFASVPTLPTAAPDSSASVDVLPKTAAIMMAIFSLVAGFDW
jgi:hypothetical protein